MIHSNSLQNPTEVNLDIATLYSPSGEEHDVPSQSSHLIPEYTNLLVSALSISKIVQEQYKNENGIPKVFGLISLSAYVVIFSTKSILPETASFAAKILHHEDISKSSTDNLPRFTNPLSSNR